VIKENLLMSELEYLKQVNRALIEQGKMVLEDIASHKEMILELKRRCVEVEKSKEYLRLSNEELRKSYSNITSEMEQLKNTLKSFEETKHKLFVMI